MRNVFLAICLVFFMTATAYAGGEKSCESGWWSKVANECYPHHEKTVDTDTDTHRDELDTQAGIGADVVIWQNETDKLTFIKEVTAEYRHDFNNDSDSIYGVVRVNLWEKIKSFFSKGE